MRTYSFEKLDVWQDARHFVAWIYSITGCLPPEEKFGLVLQLRRAAISIASNLAEGTARKTSKDQAHFTLIAYSSLIEVLNQLIIAADIGFVDNKTLIEGRQRVESLTYKVASLRRRQLATKY